MERMNGAPPSQEARSGGSSPIGPAVKSSAASVVTRTSEAATLQEPFLLRGAELRDGDEPIGLLDGAPHPSPVDPAPQPRPHHVGDRQRRHVHQGHDEGMEGRHRRREVGAVHDVRLHVPCQPRESARGQRRERRAGDGEHLGEVGHRRQLSALHHLDEFDVVASRERPREPRRVAAYSGPAGHAAVEEDAHHVLPAPRSANTESKTASRPLAVRSQPNNAARSRPLARRSSAKSASPRT